MATHDYTHTPGSLDSRAVVLGDVDGDGDLDIVIGNTGTNGASNEVWTNDGLGSFELKQTFAPLSKTLSLALTRFDADQKLDIVVGNDGANQVFGNQSNNGVIAFTAVNSPCSSANSANLDRETIALIAYNFDSDGDEDLIVLNGGTEISPQETQIFRKAGTPATYTLYRKINAARVSWSMTLGDGIEF